MERGLEPGFTVPFHVMFVIVTVGLRFFKVIVICECLRFLVLPHMHLTVLLDALYVMYNYLRTLLSRCQHSSSPTQTRSSPDSLFLSTPVRHSPFSPFKPKFKAFPKSFRHGRPWPPTNIPTTFLGPVLRFVLLKRLVSSSTGLSGLPYSSLRPSTPRSGRCRST